MLSSAGWMIFFFINYRLELRIFYEYSVVRSNCFLFFLDDMKETDSGCTGCRVPLGRTGQWFHPNANTLIGQQYEYTDQAVSANVSTTWTDSCTDQIIPINSTGIYVFIITRVQSTAVLYLLLIVLSVTILQTADRSPYIPGTWINA